MVVVQFSEEHDFWTTSLGRSHYMYLGDPSPKDTVFSFSSGFEGLGSGLGVREAGFGSLTQAFRFRRRCLGTEAIHIVASRFVWAILGPMCLLFSQSGKSKGFKASPYSLLNLVWHDMPP